ncbi:MAG: tRNA (adenosine(37)-N6)-threonylcarbamoyltransferase complex dimerization subunit type 1 TsaB [Lachnospiraceae bacterium]|nr:tRNA (adenosine(37)-N6)-threonylcarbamoyltransferase complex dimerization subunit type 1 TsaB [Lachnospiraceae bacterium]MBQ9605798.1 tRNA (adenosine(37)-N6)-threonylcarbamoyltransferase complex dimerization subunit type 1 TsaB [Lachnospiraceae bacterium]MBR1522854.1 tRNA (adenosine(37)-N6)-threonylcarbamoyltransferase complex dimerization subunit type 1 TsaB [Lachnospiraceae bacterium]
MNILAIDSSGLAASAAILSDDVIRAEYTVCNKLTHSETLMPMIDEVIQSSGLELKDMDAVAIAKGPGSFTGLRIGSATAKGLAEAIKKPVIEVPTVNALAQNMAGYDGNIVPLMDARRNETYTGIFTFEGEGLKTLREQCAVPLTEILADINSRGVKTIFLGDGVRVFADQIKEKCTAPFIFAPPSLRLQRASSVAVLAQRYYEKGYHVNAAEHKPTYLRVSQAERELSQKEPGKQ